MSFNFGHGGNIRQSRERFGVKNPIDFSANINPLGPSPGALAAISRGSRALAHYPDIDCKHLREGIASHLRINGDSVLVGNGSTEIIYLLARFLSRRRVLIPIPTFSGYEHALGIFSARCKFVKRVERNDFAFPIRAITGAIDEVDSIFLCNPNNPTGNLIPREELIDLIKLCGRKKKLLVLDETFVDFCPGESVLLHAKKNMYLVVLRSFSKLWGLPGLRLGYAVSHPGIIKKLRSSREPWTINALAQIAGVESLKDSRYFKRSIEFVKTESGFLFERLREIKGLRPYPPAANFVFAKIATGMASTQLYRRCGRRGIVIRDCSNFHGLNEKFIRVAVRTRKENLKLLKVLEGALCRQEKVRSARRD